MMTSSSETPPASVSALEPTTQAGEVRARWAWTEPTVWTDRMLTTLEHGVKGGRWFSLIDKVCALPTLRSAFARVKANRGSAGVDHVTIALFETRLEEHLARLARGLGDGTYRPQPIRRVWIPKPGRTEKRPLGVPTVRDRVVQTALRLVLEIRRQIFPVKLLDKSDGTVGVIHAGRYFFPLSARANRSLWHGRPSVRV